MRGGELSLFQVIFRGWPWLVGSTAALATTAALVTAQQPTTYQATATVVVTASESTPGAQAWAVTNVHTLLENRAVAETVIRRLGLGAPPESLSPDELVSRLKVTQIRDTSFLRIGLAMSSPEHAAQALNSIVEACISLNRQLGVDNAISVSVGLLHKQLDEAKASMDQAGQKLLAYQQATQLERLQKAADTALGLQPRISALDASIAAERARVAVAEKELASRSRKLEAPRKTDGEAPLLEDARRREENEVPLPITSASANPVYEVLDYQAANARIKISALQAERDMLAKQAVTTHLSPLYEGKRRMEQLELDYRLNSETYTDLVRRLEDAKKAAVSRSINIDIADPAVPPASPTRPHVFMSAVMAGTLGFIGALLGLVALPLRPIR